MITRMLCVAVALLPLGGCGLSVGEMFRNPVGYFSADDAAPDDPRLARILYSASDTPGHQGYLYVAMAEAQIASQHAGRALVRDDLASIKNEIGDVLYAVDPSAAPSWQARSAGLVEGWAGKGYGVRRAVRNIQSEARALGARTAMAEGAARVAACTDTMLTRVDQIAALGGQVLAADSAAGLRPTLEQIDSLARELYYGTANLQGDRQALTQCGLQDTRLVLQAMTPASA